MVLLNIGDQIGPFMVEKELSRGGMAIIYQARLFMPKGDFPRHVVIKVARQGYDDFLRDEEEHLRNLHHPHIIRPIPIPTQTGEIWQKRCIRCTSGEPPLWYMALEYLGGDSLATLLQFRKKLPSHVAVEIASQVGMALDYLHCVRGVAHLDVRPDNILFRQDPLSSNGKPEAVLGDFGIAWHNKRLPTDSYGDLPYVAPERRQGEPVTFASDVYSLGIVLYEMLTGVRPYPQDEDNVNMADSAAAVGVPVLPSELGHGTPQLDSVVLRAAARRPEDRYSMISTFLEDLVPVELEAKTRSGWEKLGWKQPLKWGGGLLLICLLATISFIAGRQSGGILPPSPTYTATILPSDTVETTPPPIVVTVTLIPTQPTDSPIVPTQSTMPMVEPAQPTPGLTRPPTSTPKPTNTPTPTWTPSPRPPTPTLLPETVIPGATKEPPLPTARP